jgi:hypothetical protein
MIENLEKYIPDPLILYQPAANVFGGFVVGKVLGKVFEIITSPGAQVVHAFVLGYYLPWLIFAKGLDDSVFSEDHLALSDKFTTELYVFEAATKLQLDIDRDYIYNIKPNALIEKYSISQKLLSAGREEKAVMAFSLGISLSESVITYNDSTTRNECIREAINSVHKMGLEGGAEDALQSLYRCDKTRFDYLIENFAVKFIESHM